jgi:hypothetical protein
MLAIPSTLRMQIEEHLRHKTIQNSSHGRIGGDILSIFTFDQVEDMQYLSHIYLLHDNHYF